ncbi:hypothetical protein tinsulaeT_37100 [Thalassotalea insulae]|uniref:N-acetyltransferase domain-containing protein n=1 Tax=Thalassotalea insulae TaxID=2056778 RepID=A0ABQ6GWR4_9GAMM|nr:GNAT family protein [Thalassotalea insulae]GLX80370.1 hypothetical protein tinsulaeT_37100 [Thalassotalea insulae]
MVAIAKAELTPAQEQGDSHWQTEFEQLQRQQINANERLHWMIRLREICDTYVVDETDGDLLLQLALRLCDWPLVLHLTELIGSKQRGLSGEVRARIAGEYIAIHRAEAWIQIGSPAQAVDTLRSALLTHYQTPELFSFYGYAQQKLQTHNNGCWPTDACMEQELVLTPLQHFHIESFRWIYSQYSQSKEQDEWQEQSIAQLCNLPRFENDQHWQDWLQVYAKDPRCFLFAVVHSKWGVIGSVSLEIFNDVGFFYYWLGEDFQGMGFGPKAVNLLLNLGFDYLGMHCCYAKAYDYNEPSQKALNKIGFKRLSFEVEPPYDHENLYYLGPEKSEVDIKAELEQLFVDMESELELV